MACLMCRVYVGFLPFRSRTESMRCCILVIVLPVLQCHYFRHVCAFPACLSVSLPWVTECRTGQNKRPAHVRPHNGRCKGSVFQPGFQGFPLTFCRKTRGVCRRCLLLLTVPSLNQKYLCRCSAPPFRHGSGGLQTCPRCLGSSAPPAGVSAGLRPYHS